jgi:hypothetical protein
MTTSHTPAPATARCPDCGEPGRCKHDAPQPPPAKRYVLTSEARAWLLQVQNIARDVANLRDTPVDRAQACVLLNQIVNSVREEQDNRSDTLTAEERAAWLAGDKEQEP